MSDVNVVIESVDQSMDLLDAYMREIRDLRAHVSFELNSLEQEIEQEKMYREERKEELDRLLDQTKVKNEELLAELEHSCFQTIETAKEGIRKCAGYIQKLNRIVDNPEQMGCMRDLKYYVVIVDSAKYPQTAEHISRAQKRGFPEFVTIDRERAAQRRQDSLSGIKRRSEFDRDEWPMACFLEGGQGADVFYIEGHDNRGAGAALSHQMRGIPNGARVRIRVI